MCSADWIRGVLHAFQWVNARRNVSSDFDFLVLDGDGSLKERLIKKLSQNVTNVEVFLSPVENLEVDLTDALHGWLFVYMGVDNFRKQQDGSRLVDVDEHFEMSDEDSRIQFCRNLATTILEFCNPTETFSVRLQADEGYLAFGKNFVFQSENAIWFLRLGEYF